MLTILPLKLPWERPNGKCPHSASRPSVAPSLYLKEYGVCGVTPALRRGRHMVKGARTQTVALTSSWRTMHPRSRAWWRRDPGALPDGSAVSAAIRTAATRCPPWLPFARLWTCESGWGGRGRICSRWGDHELQGGNRRMVDGRFSVTTGRIRSWSAWVGGEGFA